MSTPRPSSPSISWRRLRALCYKETLQILRDPSSNIIAFVLPVIMLVIFGCGINLDSASMRIGLVMEDTSPEARRFADSFIGSPYITAIAEPNRASAERDLTEARIRGIVVVAQDFTRKLKHPDGSAPVQIITDGSEPNIAEFVEAYGRGAWAQWLQQRSTDLGLPVPAQIQVEPRFWFNPSAESRNYLIPGSITLIMTVVGALLSALVVAREWERGTMEALLASPVTRTELLLAKLIPYYVLGIVSLFICVGVGTFVLGVPFRGSVAALFVISSLFLLGVLGQGLLVSTLLRNQFNAAQAALNLAFLPAMMFSGFIFEISSMPAFIRGITYLFTARYFVSCIQTLFQAGDLPGILLPNGLFLLAAATIYIALTFRFTRKRLD